MGPSDRSHGGSCHGNRGCRLIPQDLSCPRILQTSLLSHLSLSFWGLSLPFWCFLCTKLTPRSNFLLLFSRSTSLYLLPHFPAFSHPHASSSSSSSCSLLLSSTAVADINRGNKLQYGCQGCIFICAYMCLDFGSNDLYRLTGEITLHREL